jgi:hypothetical protein
MIRAAATRLAFAEHAQAIEGRPIAPHRRPAAGRSAAVLFGIGTAFRPPFFTSIRRCQLGAILGENSGAPLIGGSAGSRSHLGCQISRNFHASADFDNDRSGPAHGLLL